MAHTPTIDQFLSAIAGFVRQKDGVQIRDYLRVEPPLDPIYESLANEVRAAYPKGSGLDKKCENLFKAQAFGADGEPWQAFTEFIKVYLEFFRDVSYANLLATHQLLTSLVKYGLASSAQLTLQPMHNCILPFNLRRYAPAYYNFLVLCTLKAGYDT